MLSIFIPLGIMISLAFVVSTLILKQDISISGKTLLRFSSDMSAVSWRATKKAALLVNRRCPDMLDALTRTRAFTPYIRDIGVLENGEMTCSFVSGEKRQPFSQLSGLTLPALLPERMILVAKRMAEGPDRPVILYAEKISAQKAVFTIVDSQYIQELMDILAAERSSVFRLTMGNGNAIVSGVDSGEKPFLTQRFTSANGDIHLRVETSFSTLSAWWLQNLLIFILLSLCFSFLFVLLYRRWRQKSLSLGREIERGIANNEFQVHYQPVFNVGRSACGGAEALLRWPQPHGRFISPDIFITAAENEGKIVALTRHLFDLIAKDVSRWKVPEGFYISVNIAPEHLISDDFVSDVMALKERLAKLGLILELTERSLIAEPAKVSAKLELLRSQQVEIAIDDFGTGYCSLSYLQQLPADYLKIDRTFINTIDTSGSDVPILDTIITLSQNLGLQVVAEGVSSKHQLRYILDQGVNYIQGYLYARPMSSADFMVWLDKDVQQQNRIVSE
ncbi:diguanylate cyclase [Citrobacter rodentium]|nr:diguanylate cyclase [Citrobacter rodentium]